MLDANWNAGYVCMAIKDCVFFSPCFLPLLSLFAALRLWATYLWLELVGGHWGLHLAFLSFLCLCCCFCAFLYGVMEDGGKFKRTPGIGELDADGAWRMV
jgi:hypothetical protein